jgi:hypothetical protein
MEHHITVRFSDGQECDFRLDDGDTAGITWEQAQAWIDEEYVNTGYEAANPVATTPLADKILRVAMAYGPQPFVSNTAWARRFARCTGRAIGRIDIAVDVARQVIGSPGTARAGQSETSTSP